MGLFGRLLGGGGRDDRAEAQGAAPADEQPGGQYPDLDPRVAQLLTDFEHRRFGLGPTGSVDYATCRNAVLDLYEQVTDEPSRVALIRFHGALMSSGVDGLRREGRDPSELEALWREDYYGMLVRQVVDADGNVDQAALDRVEAREKEAGHLGEGETLQIQRASREARDETGLRTARAIGERAIALWTTVLRSIAPAQRETLLQAFAAEGQRHWLAEDEVKFLLDEAPEQNLIVAFGWQAERLAVLAWAVGLMDLPAHDAKCDPTEFATLVPPTSRQSFEAFLAGLQRRDPREIETVAADIDRSYWAAHDAAAQGAATPGVDLGVMAERLRAVIWVLGRDHPEWP